ncbi:LysM domain-containing protein [Desulfitobacterium sp.]|uniref:LysM peptidoglycan-binding domain-containing protein n=1 Tax=Desulfitobacterium sp. TaxID=49981 RepID=UPI002B210BD6|nr:LysM domain-containing protein [Desulfitobacterium sp.]MEA4900314.1 LysM domain-containing protein [Desulfitobacterium sp.]
MKKKLGVILSISLISSAMALPTLAADTTTSATVPAPAPSASAPAPVSSTKVSKPTVNGTIDTSKMAADSVYTVVSGDVFSRIAQKYGLSVDALAKLNPHIKNINWIYPGDKIIVKVAPPAAPAAPAAPATVAPKKLFHGFGEVSNYRIRGEKNDNLNITTASAVFDEDGKIVDLTWDVQEITYALFPGWLDPKASQADKDAFVAKIDDKWQTKREEGYDYDMTHKKSKGAADNLTKKEWFEQLNTYESFFKGKTVAEVEAWFKKYTDANGRPYKMAYPDKLTDSDKAAVAKFSAEEKAMLVDVTTGATMSLQDPHSHFISALKEAYAARKEIK